MLRIRKSIGGLLSLIGVLASTACGGGDLPSSTGTGSADEVTQLTAALTNVPSGVLCIKLTLTGAVTNTVTNSVSAGASSASIGLGYIPAGGELTVTPTAYDLACGSVTAASTPKWAGPGVTQTVVLGVPQVWSLVLMPYSVTAEANFVPAVKAIAAGASSTYALLYDGTVRAWGANNVGQLGDGTTTNRLTPVAVSGLTGVASLAVGPNSDHACAVKTDGRLFCWGYNYSGQLGNSSTANSLVPVAAQSSLRFVQASTGGDHTCGVTTDGDVACWGLGTQGQLGSAASSLTPVLYSISGAFEEVQAGMAHSCVRGSGYLYCTGYNVRGQLGTGDTVQSTSWRASNLRTDSRIPWMLATGSFHTCAVVNGLELYCVGGNTTGALGDSTTINQLIPVKPLNVETVHGVAAGAYFTCILTELAHSAGNHVYCTGDNRFGQLGDGRMASTTTPSMAFVDDDSVAGPSQVVAGSMHACALVDGFVWCWGSNSSGQVGDGTLATRLRGVRVAF